MSIVVARVWLGASLGMPYMPSARMGIAGRDMPLGRILGRGADMIVSVLMFMLVFMNMSDVLGRMGLGGQAGRPEFIIGWPDMRGRGPARGGCESTGRPIYVFVSVEMVVVFNDGLNLSHDLLGALIA